LISVSLFAGSRRAAGDMFRSSRRRETKAWLVGAKIVQAVVAFRELASPLEEGSRMQHHGQQWARQQLAEAVSSANCHVRSTAVLQAVTHGVSSPATVAMTGRVLCVFRSICSRWCGHVCIDQVPGQSNAMLPDNAAQLRDCDATGCQL
jgi:hypothetical protein